MPRLTLAALAVLSILIAACETKVERPRYAAITFAHQEPITLNVATLRIVPAYQQTGVPPHVEHEFPVNPLETVKRWGQDRLSPIGQSGEIVVTIHEASVVEVALEKESGLTGIFTEDQSERYDAVIKVTIQANDPTRGLTASTSAETKRSRTVPEDLTLNEREAVWYALTEALMRDVDKQLESSVRQHLAGFLAQ